RCFSCGALLAELLILTVRDAGARDQGRRDGVYSDPRAAAMFSAWPRRVRRRARFDESRFDPVSQPIATAPPAPIAAISLRRLASAAPGTEGILARWPRRVGSPTRSRGVRIVPVSVVDAFNIVGRRPWKGA